MTPHPPYSQEAEQSVIGALILDNRVLDELIDKGLQADDFYFHDHKIMFQTVCQLAEENQPFDLVTLSERVKQKYHPKDSVLAYLAEIAHNTPSVANVLRYGEIVREHATLRRLMQIGLDCTRMAAEKDASDKVLETIEQQLFALTQGKSRDFIDVDKSLKKAVTTISEHFENGNRITGVTTGLNDLDEYTVGLQPADLVILVGRPSMGKTWFVPGMGLVTLFFTPIRRTELVESQ